MQAPLGPVTYHAVQAIPGAEPPILSQDSLGGATIIYEQGEWAPREGDVDGEEVGERVPDPLLPTPTDVAGSAELATQTALDLLLNMSAQRELATGSLQVRRAGGAVPDGGQQCEASQPSTVSAVPSPVLLQGTSCKALPSCG